jgi:hypothetical protein
MSMQASTTGHPGPEEVMAYCDGEAPAEVAAHIETCPACTERAAGYARLQNRLQRLLYRFDCPDPHTLSEYELDLLEPVQRTSIAAHATECEACRAELQTLRAYLAVPNPRIAESFVARARRLVARLLVPTRDLAYGGLRGSSQVSPQLFEVEDVTITVARGSTPNSLLGLVVVASEPAEAMAGRQVRLVPVAGEPRTSTLDELGNFEFADVPAGVYELELDLPEARVSVEELQVD